MPLDSKNPSKKGLLEQKVGVYSRKPKKTGLLTLSGALFKSGVALKQIMIQLKSNACRLLISSIFDAMNF